MKNNSDGIGKELAKAKKDIAERDNILNALELIHGANNLDDILDYLTDLATGITNAEGASVLLLENDQLYFAAASGIKSSVVKRMKLDKNEGVAGWVLQNGRAIIVPDVEADERFSKKVDNVSGFTTHSLLAIPLIIEQDVIGVVETLNKKDGTVFNETDSRLLSHLAMFAALSISKARARSRMNDLLLSIIRAISNAIEAKDPFSRGHNERIRRFSLVIARELGLSEKHMQQLEIAALLHDIGKLGVSESILCKKGRLTLEEMQEMRKHPSIAAGILNTSPQMDEIVPAVRHHQERFDGKGYPDGLSGSTIPLLARILAAADAFDAMTSDRAYRVAMPDSQAVVELECCAGTQFDPDCVAALVRGYKKGQVITASGEKNAGK